MSGGEKLLKIYRQAGIKSVPGKKPNTLAGMRIEGTQAPMEISFTDVVRTFWPPELPGPYRTLSGAAHSRSWVPSSWDEFAATGVTVLNVMQMAGQIVETWLALWEEYSDTSSTREREQVKMRCVSVGAHFVYQANN